MFSEYSVLRNSLFPVTVLFLVLLFGTIGQAEQPPNILWISCEDISPNLGCYGDKVASTPNLDRLASEGVRFDRAYTHAGVCAVLRSGVITGVYPISIGSQHMRSKIVVPPPIRCFSEYLRAQGYYCTNRSKTDYQFSAPFTAWDRQGTKHNDWRGRGEGQPFFSVINLTVSHESQIRHGSTRHRQILSNLKPEQVHDPNEAAKTLPIYIPDTPEARKNWAWYHDNISEMDRQAGEILRRLEDDGLADNTLVVFWSDHGQGMPRGKRWIYDSGTHVPLIMRWPGELEPNTSRGDLVTLIDLSKTMLAIAGIDPPDYMHGRVLIGEAQQAEPDQIFFHRDRMDEAYELQRGARDRRFRYLRNYEPEKTYAQGIDYMDKMPAMQAWRSLNREGNLTPEQSHWFARPKPIEELYDCVKDPHNVYNLASKPEFQDKLTELRKATEEWQITVGDMGMIPEPILMERINELKRPVAPPTAKVKQGKIELTCETLGASLTFRKRQNGKWSSWLLYPHGVSVNGGVEMVEAKACRIGCPDSSVIRFPIR